MKPDRILLWMKILCALLALFAVVQFIGLFEKNHSLASLKVPEIPKLAAEEEKNSEDNSPSKPEGPPRRPPRRGKPEPDPAIRHRVEFITKSEIFGALPKPPPMALFGIAGNKAFLRAPNGAMGSISEGESLGDLKLIRIGINRVLIEHDGKKQELTIFSGVGGSPLLENP